MPPAPTDSLSANVAPLAAGAHVTAATFLGDVPALALGDGTVLLGPAGERRVAAHPDGAVLCGAADRDRIVTGGDDGRVVATRADGTTEEVAAEKGWIDALALNGSGAVAWATGRTVRARSAKGEVKSVAAGSSVRGVAFAPKGYRVAFSHYNGASLWFPNTAEAPQTLDWKGSHLDIVWSPDGRFVVTSMQENAMHGWRIADAKHMRMSGYPAKPRSLSWSPDGSWLATSGAEACVVWPFEGKDGPMGKPPRECGVRPARVSQACFHPRAGVLALGYEDGFVMMVRLKDNSEILIRREDEAGGAVSALAWNAAGTRLVFGTRGGAAGILALPAG
jgi:WD40 repeat protein